jgi:hypothetical protein
MKSIKSILLRVRKRAIFFRNLLSLSILIIKPKSFPHVVIPERLKVPFRVLGWVIALTGVVTSVVTFTPVVAILLSGGILLAGKFVDNVFFSFQTRRIFPLFDTGEFTSHILGFSFDRVKVEGKFLPIILVIFDTEDSCHAFYDALREWIGTDDRVPTDRITFSIIFHSKRHYSLHCYPSIDSRDVEQFFAKALEERRRRSLTDVQIRAFAFTPIGYTAILSPDSTLPNFVLHYSDKLPCFINPLVPKAGDGYRRPEGIDAVLLKSVKIRDVDQLTRKDVEFGLIELNPDNYSIL